MVGSLHVQQYLKYDNTSPQDNIFVSTVSRHLEPSGGHRGEACAHNRSFSGLLFGAGAHIRSGKSFQIEAKHGQYRA